MLSVAKGYSTSYLTDQVAKGRENYYTDAVDTAGEPPGQWYGAGATALGLAGEVDAEVLEDLYTRMRDPRGGQLPMTRPNYRTAEEIHTALVEAAGPGITPEQRDELWEQAQSKARQSVAFFDATFSATKSVSVLGVAFERAAVEAETAGRWVEAQAWRAHHRAVEDAVQAGARASIDYLQDVAGYSREGTQQAPRWIDAHQFIVAGYLQHDSRERDPQLHCHQAIFNGVECADGKWRTLDGAALYLHRPAAGAVGERVMEAHLAEALGVRFETRPDGKAREIVGVSEQLMEMFSARSRAIGPKVEKLCREWEQLHGAPPNALERTRLAQQATLLTRPSKSHDGETIGQRLQRWEQQTRAEVGDGLRSVAEQVLAARQDAGPVAEWDPDDVVSRAVARVAAGESSWTRADAMRAVSDCLPARLGLGPEQVRPLLDQLTDQVVVEAVRLSPTPDLSLRPAEHLLADGGDVYARPGSPRYAAPGQLAAEQVLREAAVERGAMAVTPVVVDNLLDRYREHGIELGADQAAAVRGVLTSGAQVEVLSAPAGAGKTVVVGALNEAWTDHGRRVWGLAPSQNAADVMSDEGVAAVNITRWLMQPTSGLSEGDIVVVDEAGMATTQQVVAVHERCRAAGAKLLLVGDPAQLGAVGPGGALPDLLEHAKSYGLAEVRRFRNEWEGPASLGLRAGEDAVLGEYEARGRIRAGGDESEAESAALRAWTADVVEGRESLLLVGSNDAAGRVSGMARAELVRLGRVAEDGVYLGRDGNTAGVGDVVQARQNGWRVASSRVPINRATYTVTEVHEDGGLTVVPTGGQAAAFTLPGDYVGTNVALAYASTVHAAQGRTVDTAHAVLGSGAQLSQAYVALTRGRHANTAWMITRAQVPDSPVGEAVEVKDRTGRAVLGDVLAREHRDQSALAERDDLAAEEASESTVVGQLLDGIDRACAGRTGDLLDRLAADGVISEGQRRDLANDDAMSAVERLLRAAELDGHDRGELLREVLEGRSLTGARSPGQVLHHRLHHRLDVDTVIGGFRDLVPSTARDDHRMWLGSRADDADARRVELGREVAEARPEWAVTALGDVPEDPVERERWETRAGWAAAYREVSGHDSDTDPLGSAPPAGLAEKHTIWRTAHEALGLVERGPDEGRMSEGQLRARIAGWERERVWAPAAVKAQWSATSEAADAKRVDGVLQEAHGDDRGVDTQAEALVLAETADALEDADEVRRAWWAHTEQTRLAADRATAELTARDIDVNVPERRVTAAEWLQAHEAEQVVEDQHRPIDVLTSEVEDDVEHDADAVVETSVPDIRDTAERDRSEVTAPARVPASAVAAREAVARAQEALAEMRAREDLDSYASQDLFDEDVHDDTDADVDVDVAAWT